jgi:hypothetical protein
MCSNTRATAAIAGSISADAAASAVSETLARSTRTLSEQHASSAAGSDASDDSTGSDVRLANAAALRAADKVI